MITIEFNLRREKSLQDIWTDDNLKFTGSIVNADEPLDIIHVERLHFKIPAKVYSHFEIKINTKRWGF